MRHNSLFRHWSYRLFAPGTMLRERYEALRKLLNYDILCHEQMAEFQEMLYGKHPQDLVVIRKRFTQFSAQVKTMVNSLDTIAPGKYTALKNYHKKFDFYTRFLIAPPSINYAQPFVIFLDKIDHKDKTIGNKAKHLALLKKLSNISIPNGYTITTGGFHYFIEYNNLRPKIDKLLQKIDISSNNSLRRISKKLQNIITQGEIPPILAEEMLQAFEQLEKNNHSTNAMLVAVRSNAIIEDSGLSFAGQYITKLKVSKENLIKSYKEVLASKYSPEALFYRISHALGDEETAMSVLVQKMVPAVTSGVVYTHDLLSKAKNVHIHATLGLGEHLVGGAKIPEEHIFDRRKQLQCIGKKNEQDLLDESSAITIAETAIQIEDFFTVPQDIEWAIGNNKLHILQTRELTTIFSEEKSLSLTKEAPLIEGMIQASAGVGYGQIYIINAQNSIHTIPQGAIVVSADSPPEYVQFLGKVAAVISEKGSRASHFATVAREFGVPFLTGKKVRDLLTNNMLVTVDANRGAVFLGKIDNLLRQSTKNSQKHFQSAALHEAIKFITPLELIDPLAPNFTPEGCRSMHDIIRFCHEKALQSMFSTARLGTGRGSLRLVADIPLDVFLFDVGGGFATDVGKRRSIPLAEIDSMPFLALWKGMSHPNVQWKQKPFDWKAYDNIELAGGIPPKKESFAFASYAVISKDYLHFNIRFGYHFTIVDVLLGENSQENYCLLRFAGGGGDYDHRLLRIDFIFCILQRLGFQVEHKGDLLEGKLQEIAADVMKDKLDMLGRLLGATKLMDMVLKDSEMVANCVEDFFNGRYSFSEEG